MPLGIDMTIFSPNAAVERKQNSLLFLARIAPSKHADILIQALPLLQKEGIPCTVSIYGDALAEHTAYKESLQQMVTELGLENVVTFYAGIPNRETPNIYRSHDIFVNCSQSGMFDKTIFEAAACGCRVLASSKDFAKIAGDASYFDMTPENLADKLTSMLNETNDRELEKQRSEYEALAKEQSLTMLTEKLAVALGAEVSSERLLGTAGAGNAV